MILYVAVARCPKCGRPVLGYLREEKKLTDERKRVMAITLSCLHKDCGWLDVVVPDLRGRPQIHNQVVSEASLGLQPQNEEI